MPPEIVLGGIIAKREGLPQEVDLPDKKYRKNLPSRNQLFHDPRLREEAPVRLGG
jgi:hypothetical protein